jgi:hypothetical protein
MSENHCDVCLFTSVPDEFNAGRHVFERLAGVTFASSFTNLGREVVVATLQNLAGEALTVQIVRAVHSVTEGTRLRWNWNDSNRSELPQRPECCGKLEHDSNYRRHYLGGRLTVGDMSNDSRKAVAELLAPMLQRTLFVVIDRDGRSGDAADVDQRQEQSSR